MALDGCKDSMSVGKTVTGERSAVDFDGVNTWIQQNWSGTMSRYHPRDIFNADETALCLANAVQQDACTL